EGRRPHPGLGARLVGLGVHHRPDAVPALHVRRHPLGGHRRPGDRHGRPVQDAHARRLGGARRHGRGRRVGGARRPGLELGDRRRPARSLASQGTRPRTHRRRAAAQLRRRRRRPRRLGRRAGRRADGPRPPAPLAPAAQAPGRARAAPRRRGRPSRGQGSRERLRL
ncbi:MAG: hypothetical protein AVDCRST_MAG85-425, partial [uncultured Solirubrobacteraceae bacterium]